MGSRKRAGFWAPAVTAALLGAAACAGDSSDSAAANAFPSTAAPVAASQSDAALAPDFTLPLYSGGEFVGGVETVSLSDLRGKAVVVNFWAPLCPPCRAEMPDFEALWQELQSEDVMFLGVDVGPYTGLGDRASAVEFLEEIGVSYPTGQAVSADVVRDYQVLGMPTTAFIDRDGRLVRKWTGGINEEKLRELTLQLLQ